MGTPVRFRARVPAVVATALGILVLTAPVTSRAAEAASVPQVGECLNIPAAQLRVSGAVVEAEVVDCRAPHTIEVARVISAPSVTDPFTSDAFAGVADSCGELGVWNEVGVNRPVAGVVRAPLSIEPRYIGLRGAEPVLVCGAVAMAAQASGERAVTVVSRPFADLGTRARAQLRYCLPTSSVRAQVDTSAALPCDERPRWQVDSMIVWTAFYDDYPGRAVMRARAQQLCGSGGRALVPTRAEWEAGVRPTWCLRSYP